MRIPSTRSFRISCVIAVCLMGLLGTILPVGADSFDWRYVDGHNWNTPIKNQFGGTCWDFSSCATLEAKYKLTRNDFTYDPDVSEQHICWETNPDMGSTGGGWGTAVLNYFTSHGVVSEEECPYQPSSPDVGILPYWDAANGGLAPGWQNRVWKSVSNSNGFTNDTNTMKAYLKSQGPLLVGIWAGHDLYGSVADLKANYRAPDASGYDHQVSLVGYYDDPEVPTGGYWVIKNSWGTGGSDNGYYFIPYGNIEIHNDISAITGPVYYTGAMAAATWKGSSNTWSVNANNWTNNAGGADYAWENKETTATFNAPASAAITVAGSVVAHGVTINSGATGYTFNGGSITITSAGLTANESATFNSSVYVGAPQTWNIAGGKTLTLGSLHTIISDLTLQSDGNTTINGSIDGGGVINIYGGAAPGKIMKKGNGTLSLTGAGTYSAPVTVYGGTLNFAQPTGATANFSSVISNGINSGITYKAPVTKINGGTIILSGANGYSGATTVSDGALQADSGVGLPAASLLILDGGVIQSNGTTTFTRRIGTATNSNRFQMTANGGGFSAGAGPMTVNIGNDLRLLTWGNTVGTNVVGTLKFGSLTAANVTTFQNPINLSGAMRVIQVNDNINSSGDYAVMSGVISNSSGTSGILKTGNGLLVLSAKNTFNGTTTISAGALQASFGQGIPGSLDLNGGVLQSSITDSTPATFNYSLGSTTGQFRWISGGGGFSAGAGPLTVNVGGNATPSTLDWGTAFGTNIVGTLKFGSTTSANVTTFQNPIDLNGLDRTIQVDDNILSAADYTVISGVISNSSGDYGIKKTGAGLLMLTGSNTYTGATTISGGALQADFGTGIPDSSLLVLDGGVFQSNGTLTFTRSLGNAGGAVQWTASGGGFAAGAGPLTVNIGGLAQPSTLVWGTDASSQLVGTLKFGSASAANTTTFKNNIDLGNGDRTIQIDDNPNSTSDNVVLSGNILGNGSLTISGTGLLKITGANNTYSGLTTVSGGTVDLASPSHAAIPGNLNLTATSGSTEVRLQGYNQLSSSAVVSFSGTAAESRLILLGHPTTLAGISDPDGLGVIENTQDQTGIGNVNLTVANTADCSFSGAIRNTVTGTGVLVLTKNGTGTLQLTGANIAYTGGTTVNGGRLILQDTSNPAFLGSPITISSGLELNATTTDFTFSNRISGAGSLTKSGLRTVTLSGSNIYYYGGTTINDGTLVLQNTNNGAFLVKNIVDNATLEFKTSGVDLNYYGAVSGTGGLNKTGPNTLTIAGTVPNSYTGDTYVYEGILVLSKITGPAIPGDLYLSGQNGMTETRVAGNNQIAPTAVVNFFGGYWPHFELLGHSITLAGISDPTGVGVIENTQDQAAGNATLTINNSNNYTYGGYIRDHSGGTGTLALIKSGSGTLTITGTTSGQYTGGLTVNDGTLDYSGGTLPSCNYTVNGGTLNIGALSASIGAFQITGGSLNGTGTLTSNATYDIRGGTVNAILAGSVGLTKSTAGTATVNNPAYTGTTTVADGTLNFTGALPGGNYVVSGGNLNLGAFSNSIGTFRITGGSISGSGTLTSSSNYDIQGGTVNVKLAGAALALNKTNSGTAILNGANTYGGTTTISGGALQADFGVGISYASFLNLNGGVLQSNNATTFTRSLGISGSNFQWTTLGGGFSAGGGPMTVRIGGGDSLAWGTTVGTNIVGTLKLSSNTANSYTTFTNDIDLAGGNRTIQVDDNSSSAADFAVLSGVISNSSATAATLTKTGAGLLILTGNNTFNGTTTIYNGALQLGNGGEVGNLLGNVTNFGTLAFNHSNDFTYDGVVSGSGNLIQQGSGRLTLTNNNTYSGGTTIAAGTLQIGSGGTTGSISGNVANNGALAFNRVNDYVFSGAISGTGSVVHQGSSILTLNGSNTYTGGTTIDVGTLQIGSGATTGSILGDVVNNGVLAFNRSDDIAFDGLISGTGNLVQKGSGVLALTANNDFDGSTLIEDGTLALTAGGHLKPNSDVENDHTFLITDGSHSFNTISGSGSMLVGDSASIEVSSIQLDSLTIGGDYSSMIPARNAIAPQTVPVPEPSTLALLASLASVLAAAYFRRQKR